MILGYRDFLCTLARAYTRKYGTPPDMALLEEFAEMAYDVWGELTELSYSALKEEEEEKMAGAAEKARDWISGAIDALKDALDLL